MLTGEHPSIRLAEGKLGKIVQNCTMISPEKRYQSAVEIIKELEKEKKKPQKFFKMVAALILCAAISIFVFAEEKKQEQPAA